MNYIYNQFLNPKLRKQNDYLVKVTVLLELFKLKKK